MTVLDRHTFDLANATALNAGNTGYDSVSGTRGAVADTAIKHVGSASAKITGTGTTLWVDNLAGNPTTHARRAYVYLDGLPSTTTRIWSFRNVGDTADVLDVRITAAGQVQIRNSSLVQVALSSMSLATGQWYRLEMKAAAGTCTVRIFAPAKLDNDVADYTEQISGAYTSQGLAFAYAAAPGSSTWNLHIDDEVGGTDWVNTAFPAPPPGGALSVVGAFGNSGYAGAVTSVQANLPGTAQANDMALVIASINAPSRSLLIPSGWTLLAAGPQDIATSKRSYLLKRRLVAGDAGQAVITQWSNTAHPMMAGIVVRGADAVLGPVVHDEVAVSSSVFTIPAYTPPVDDCMAVALVSGNAGAPFSLTPPASWTEDRDASSTDSIVVSAEVLHRQLVGQAGVQQGGLTSAWSAAVNPQQVYVVVLQPAGSPPPPTTDYRVRYNDVSGLWDLPVFDG